MLQVDRLLARPRRPLSLIWQSTLPGGHSRRAAATMHLILLNSKMNKVVVKNLDIPQSNKNFFLHMQHFCDIKCNDWSWQPYKMDLGFLHPEPYKISALQTPSGQLVSEVACGFTEKPIRMNCSRNNNHESKKRRRMRTG
jgi:hypothetical protein